MSDVSLTTGAAATLAVALCDDPFYRSISVASGDDPHRRLLQLTHYFEHSIAEGREVGNVSFTGVEGAAIWITSDDAARLRVARERKLAALAQILGDEGFANYQRIVAAMEHALPLGIDPSCWYLSIIGVSPESRGRGLGGGLLSPMLAKADALAAACFLETFNPRSIPFYERLGFVVIDTLVEPVTGASYEVMLREPKKHILAA